jgi:LacI family transcriptional regulator
MKEVAVQRRPTMHDVAALAGVSIKTVSRVINGEPRVAPATIAKVEQAVAALGFERNDLARSLRPGHRTHTLGVIIEDLHNPFFPALMEGVDLVAQDHGYLVMSASTHADANRERELAKALLRRRIDGLVLVPFASDHRYISKIAGRVPIVFIDRPAKHMQADSVVVDNAGGARQAVAHLVGQGHRRIAFVGDGGSVESARLRLENFRQAMAESVGGPDDTLMVLSHGLIGEAETAHGDAAMRSLLALSERKRPTAVLTASNLMTVGALRALRGRQDAVALVGFDDLDVGELLGITVVHTKPRELGRVAAELLLERIGGRADRPQHVLVSTELVTRGSGEIAP